MKKIFRSIVILLLHVEARLVIKRFRPRIIAITGSVGKTSTKEAIATLLSEHYRVGKSPKSYNSEIGLPLAILGIDSAWNSIWGWTMNLTRGFQRFFSRAPYPQILVLEMGVDRPGDFDLALTVVRPNTTVITAIGEVPVHVEFFDDPKGIAQEKSKMITCLDVQGTAILNADDPLVFALRSKTSARILTYGFSELADIKAVGYRLLIKNGKPNGITFKIEYSGKVMPFKILGVFGKHSVYTFLAAAAVGISENLNLIEIAEGCAQYTPPPGRLNAIDGLRGSFILDDTYNASPLAAYAALEVLAETPGKRKIVVLGDMLELGKFSGDEHRKVGDRASSVATVLVTVGIRTKVMDKSSQWFPTADEAAEFLKDFIQEGDVILIKGSQGMRMERVTLALMAHPDEAEQKLVRQDSHWKKR